MANPHLPVRWDLNLHAPLPDWHLTRRTVSRTAAADQLSGRQERDDGYCMNKLSSITDRGCFLSIVPLLMLLVASALPCRGDLLTDAVHRGDAARIRLLLSGQPDLQARDVDGNTALHWA